MQIQVSGKGVDIGESLSQHAKTRIEETISKYSDRINHVQIIVSKESHRFRVDIHANLGTHSGLVVKSHALGEDVYVTFDSALDKVEKQLRRYKRKLTNHHRISYGGAEPEYEAAARKYILPANVGESEDEAEQHLSGVVIAEKPTSVDRLTVSQAVMKMDLQDLPALMFYNASNGRLNVVYRRADGNISWVDPEAQEKAA